MAGEFWSGAADLAAMIMREKELPWRTAHQIVSTLVRLAIEEKKSPKDVTSEYLDRAALEYPDYGQPLGLSDELIREAMDPTLMINRRTLIGGPAPVRVREEIQRSRELLENNRDRVEDKRRGLRDAESRLEEAIDALIG